jgi:RIO kinase 2
MEKTYHFLLDMIIRFAEHGLIHSDFNEYNILIDEEEPFDVYVIDFPQMVSTDHPDAKFYFDRDVACVERLFRKKHNFTCERDSMINFEDIEVKVRLDREVKASGYWKWAKIKSKEVNVMEKVLVRENDQEVQESSEEEVESEYEEEESEAGEEESEVEEETEDVTELVETKEPVDEAKPAPTPVNTTIEEPEPQTATPVVAKKKSTSAWGQSTKTQTTTAETETVDPEAIATE